MSAGNSTATANRELVVTRIIYAPRRLVFSAWTEPEQVARWWGPQGRSEEHSLNSSHESTSRMPSSA